MKAIISRRVREAGSTLVVALLSCLLLAISIGGYLAFVEQQHLLSMRSQAWNMALSIAEAGIEDAMQHLNSNFPVMVKDGWAVSTNGWSVTRTLPSGATYHVNIVQGGTTNQAYITSRVPINAPRWGRSFFATSSDTNEFAGTRAVRVYAEKQHMFSAGVVVKHDILLKGNNVFVDSFDSSDPFKSRSGRYDPKVYSGDRGDVATNGGLIDNVGLGNASIFGVLHTGPGCPVSLGPGGGIGTHAFQAGNPGKIQDGYLLDDSNFVFPETGLPDTTGLVPPSSGIVGVVSNYVATNLVSSPIYPVPTPAGGVTTNEVLVSSLTYPSPPPEWVTTNTVLITTNYVPIPVPGDLVTNVYTTNVTVTSFPGAGVDYLGGVTTNKAKGKHGSDTYSYNLVLNRDYSFSAISYSYPQTTYSYFENAWLTVYTTNYYNQVIPGGGTFVSSGLVGTTIVTGEDAVLVLPNGLTGVERVIIKEGASLTVYAGGTSATFNGNDWVNEGGIAGNLIIYCAPSVTSFALNGNGQFIGVLVAPNADVALNGSGKGVDDFCGSLLAKSLNLNGNYSFHYDEALSKGPPNGKFLAMSWDEVK